jgi:hypothetical protein
MKLFEDKRDSANLYLSEAIVQNNAEYEIIFGESDFSNPITKDVFIRLLEKCRSVYSPLPESTSLDIRTQFKDSLISNVRGTINGIREIKAYCNNNSLNELNVDFILKKPYSLVNSDEKFKAIKDNNYNLRCNLKQEIPLESSSKIVQDFITNLENKKKHYRYKKRFSFLTSDRLFRIDLTAVKSTLRKKGSYQFASSLNDSKILKQKETYEVEIEYVGNQMTTKGISVINDYYQKVIVNNENVFYQSFSSSNNPLHGIQVTPVIPPEKTISPLPPIEDSLRETITQPANTSAKEKNKSIIGREAYIKNEVASTTEYSSYKDEKLIIKDILDREEVEVIVSVNGEEIQLPLSSIYYQEILEVVSGTIPLDISSTEITSLCESVLNVLENHVEQLLKVVYKTNTILSYKVKKNVIQKYKQVTEQKSPYFMFIGPQPVSIHSDNLRMDSTMNILVDYAVTEKADGDRYEMIVIDSKAYLINSQQNVIDTGNTFPYLTDTWLFDGEYITRTKDNQDISLYMIFDVYYCGTVTPQPIHSYPFYIKDRDITRHSIMEDCKHNMFEGMTQSGNQETIEIRFKEYEFGYQTTEEDVEFDETSVELREIFKVSKKILHKQKKEEYIYRNDGLIYLPTKLSVKGSLEGSPSKFIHGTWNLNYKWKPPEENTIDFMVVTQKDLKKSKITEKVLSSVDPNEIIPVPVSYQQVTLMVGYDAEKDPSIDYCMAILDDSFLKTNQEDKIPFSPENTDVSVSKTNILRKNGKMVCMNDVEDVIMDKDIVEMRYNPDGENGAVWEPIRIRKDKEKPQFFTIANRIWETIQDPIYESVISGKKGVLEAIRPKDKTSMDTPEGEYYVEKEDSLNELNPLRQFHNYIKRKLIVGICSSFTEKIKVLDLSCGRGGDVPRFVDKDSNVEFLFGIDISTNVSEACQRFYKSRKKVKGVFIRGNTGKNIKDGDMLQIEDVESDDMVHSETMLNILYDKKKPLPDKYNTVYKKYRGLASSGFHLINSQFSMHYYFESQSTYEGFVTNLEDNLQVGGFFIATCYDGQRVFNLPEEGIEMKDTIGNLLYKIEKKYEIEDFTYNPDDTSNMFGNEIDVFMDTIGQTITEYLVNFDFFIEDMKQRGFELKIPKMKRKYSSLFQSKYITDGMGDFAKLVQDIETIRTEDPLFTKYADAYALTTTPELQELSSLNRFVVFQRVR